MYRPRGAAGRWVGDDPHSVVFARAAALEVRFQRIIGSFRTSRGAWVEHRPLPQRLATRDQAASHRRVVENAEAESKLRRVPHTLNPSRLTDFDSPL